METKKEFKSLIVLLMVIFSSNLIAQNWIPVFRFSNGTSTAFEHLYTTNSTEVTTWKDEGISFYVSDTYFTGSVPVYRLRKDGTPRLRLLTSDDTEMNTAKSNGFELEKTLGYIYPSDSQTGDLIYRSFKASVGDRFYTMNYSEYSTTLNNGYTAEKNLGRSFSVKPTFEINTSELNLNSNSGSNNINVTSNTSWSASSNQSWLVLSNGTNGTNNGIISFNYTSNETINTRTAIITINIVGLTSKTITVTQQGKSVSLSINPSGEKVVSNPSGSGSINVVSNISWTASSNQNWLTISSGSSGNSNGTVNYNYSANENTTSRSATITISGTGTNSQSLTVVQSGKTPNLSINPNGTQSINNASGSGIISVTSNIDWSVVSNQSWLTITSGSNGKNDGVINYSYSTNASTSVRSATISVSGNGATIQTLTLNQSGQQAEITFNPEGPINAPSTEGEVTVIITSNSNWEAATTDTWLSFYPSSGTSGLSSIKIFYSENKTNTDRTGYITFQVNGKAIGTIEIKQKTSSQISISFDANGVSHLAWPFYNKNYQAKNPVSSWENRNGWMSGREWEKNHNNDSSWGYYWGVGTHTGKDNFADDWNNHVFDDCKLDFYSPISGVVLLSDSNSYGNFVVINSDKNDKFAFLVAHLSKRFLINGQKVKIGDKIGEIGSTGLISTGCHVHCSLYKNISNPFSFSMNINNAAKFEFDAVIGGSGGVGFFGRNCYGFTPSGTFFISKSMIDYEDGLSAKICYWDYNKSIWYEKEMELVNDFYIYNSNNTHNDYRDYCVRVSTIDGETWLPSAVTELITNIDDIKANPANNGYNFYTKPVLSVPLVACSEETAINELNKVKFKLYPNPTKDILYISEKNSSISVTIQLFDLSGRIVYRNFNNNSLSFNIKGLSSGLYLVKLQADKKVYYDKIIIEN